jgi:signal transduction histidine kinase
LSFPVERATFSYAFFTHDTQGTRMNALEAAQAYQTRLRALSVRLADARESERRKLAKDLHDHVGHELGLARFKLSGILRSGDHDLPRDLLEQLQDVEEHLKESIRQSRSIGYEYFPQVLQDAGLVPALEWLAEHYAERQHISIRLIIEDDCRDVVFPSTLRGRLFTAVRECVYNAWKYAEAGEIRICLQTLDDQRLEIRIEDDGKGFDVKRLEAIGREEGGFGLFSIREMMEYLQGEFRCESKPGEGTRIQLNLPTTNVKERP